jgi:hypothetical protein
VTAAARHRAVTPIHFTCQPAAPTGLPCPACHGGVLGRFSCFQCAGSGSLDQRIDVVLTDAVEEAVALIGTRQPGLAEYRLARAQLKVAKLIGAAAEADEVDWLRYFHLGQAS